MRRYARRQVMSVPTNREGLFFLELLRKYALPEWQVTFRGRHSDRRRLLGLRYEQGRQNDVRLGDAETIGVYFDRKDDGLI